MEDPKNNQEYYKNVKTTKVVDIELEEGEQSYWGGWSKYQTFRLILSDGRVMRMDYSGNDMAIGFDEIESINKTK